MGACADYTSCLWAERCTCVWSAVAGRQGRGNVLAFNVSVIASLIIANGSGDMKRMLISLMWRSLHSYSVHRARQQGMKHEAWSTATEIETWGNSGSVVFIYLTGNELQYRASTGFPKNRDLTTRSLHQMTFQCVNICRTFRQNVILTPIYFAPTIRGSWTRMVFFHLFPSLC